MYIYIYKIPGPVVPARGGAEVALRIYYKTFHIYRTCMRRAPSRPVRACLVQIVALLSKNITCVRPRCNATPSEDFLHTSQCSLHVLHFTGHTSSHLKLHFRQQTFRQRSFSTEELSHRSFTQISFYTQQAFTQKSVYTQKLLHRTVFRHDFANNCNCKIGSRCQSREKARF